VAVAAIFLIGERYLSSPADPGTSVNGGTRRHAEIQKYLRRIQEPFTEDTAVAGQQVEFLLTDRNVAITFDPQVYLSLESTSVYTILCEHEMPVGQLGRRLPFEVSEHGTVVSPPTDEPVAEAFAELGLPRSADEAAVKEAYRTRVKNVHPDQGGDTDQFRQLQQAYATARDYCRRRSTA
jgi:DnaJ domain.